VTPTALAAAFAVGLLVAIVMFFVVVIYNDVIAMERRIDKAWANIEVVLQQRHDQLPALVDAVRGLMSRHRLIGDVRGRGLMIGVEFVRDRETKERATSERDAIVHECFKRGLLVLGAGRNAIRLSPPLVLTKQQADAAVEILGEALTAVEK